MLAEPIQRESQERQCAMTRDRAKKEELLRLALDPNGRPFVDLLARAPGRGVYVSPASLRDALKPKGLDRVFKGKAKKFSEEEIETMLRETADRLEARIVELVGLARRAGVLELGMDSVVRAQAKRAVSEANGDGWAGFARPGPRAGAPIVVVARDASDRTVRRVEESLGSATLIRASTKEELGRLLGRDEVGVVSVHPSKLADRISAESKRLAGLTSSTSGQGAEG